MPRITRGDRTYHPDELDPITGEPLEAAEAPAEELTPAQAATRELEELGAEKSGTWWSLEIDGEVVKANGAVAALEAIKAAQAAQAA